MSKGALDKLNLPSRHTTIGPEKAPHRSFPYPMGLSEAEVTQPFVGVATCWNEATPCNTALSRLAGCDTSVPGMMMAMVRLDVHSVFIRGGSILPAIAHDAGIDFNLSDVCEIFHDTPCFGNLKPGGAYVAKDFCDVGGVPGVMKELRKAGLIHADCQTASGRSIDEEHDRIEAEADAKVIHPVETPPSATGGVDGLQGNLAPDGAIVKVAGVAAGDQVFGDDRFSGTTRGFCVGHVAPVAAHVGPDCLLQDGDMITTDAIKGVLSVARGDDDLAARRTSWQGSRETIYRSGARWKCAQLVGSAKFGAVPHPGRKEERHADMDLWYSTSDESVPFVSDSANHTGPSCGSKRMLSASRAAVGRGAAMRGGVQAHLDSAPRAPARSSANTCRRSPGIFCLTANITGLLFGVLLLAGCGGIGPIGGPPPMREVAVTRDRVTITGPAGFCVDPDSTRDSEATAFVLMGNCAVISNRRSAGEPSVPAVLTASISEADPAQTLQGSIPRLNAFFNSDEGRALLSRTGDADTVEVLDSFHQGDIYYLRARDSSASDIQNVSSDYWRSYLDIGDRIATLTVLAREDEHLPAEAALATLRQFTQAVVDANSEGEAAAAPVTAPAVEPRRTPATGGALWNVGLFRRIMGG
ncbi:MAG: hypothetical protein COW55_12515 [Rhodobacteraceae bacterium CG17_big_fil_post_rev_8_21_14_2_50_65_11]|nr:MAG: hypothetical protein COW55_12515 [Rhodobacteraceae bacterium CG17_big_fil_post_rev_8_21_14_2_50_65_11]